jgi:hypothetical protein
MIETPLPGKRRQAMALRTIRRIACVRWIDCAFIICFVAPDARDWRTDIMLLRGVHMARLALRRQMPAGQWKTRLIVPLHHIRDEP